MKKIMSLAFILLCGWGPLLSWATERLDGEWIGEARLEGRAEFIKIRFETNTGQSTGILDVPLRGQRRLTISGIRAEALRVRFLAPYKGASLTFAGALKGNRMTGSLEQEQPIGSFELIRLKAVDPKIYRSYAGAYDLGGGEFLSLGPMDEAGGRLLFVHYPTGVGRFLNPLSQTHFIAGPSGGVDYPIEMEVLFVKDARGRVTSLSWRQGNTAALRAKRIPMREEEVLFRNGAINLAGTLTLPSGPGPHPAVVLIHGSGPSTRNFGFLRYFFLRQGLAVLAYDKRGSGASTGDWQSATIDDLAGDALAAVKLLRTRKDIDSRRIGLMGNSQGGWVAPLVASRSSDIAFVIARAASGLSTFENVLYEVENDLRGAGFSEAEVKQAIAFHRLVDRVITSNRHWETLKQKVEQTRNETWFEPARLSWTTTLPMPPSEALLKQLQSDTFDPRPAWEKLQCPVLVLEGELDKWVPAQESARRIEQFLERAGNKHYSIIVFPKANHGLLEAETGYWSEMPRLKRLVPAYLQTLQQWVHKYITDVPRAAQSRSKN